MPTTLVDYDFSANAGTWSSGTAPTHDTALEGWDYETGTALFAVNNSATPAVVDFTEQTTGRVRVELDWYVDDSATSGTTWVYLLPSAASVSSANAAALFYWERGASTLNCDAKYRSGTAFNVVATLARHRWYRVRLDLDIANRKYDIYLDGRLWIKDAISPINPLSGVGKVAFLSTSAATATYVDNLRVTHDPASDDSLLVADDFTLGTSAISDTAPATDNRNKYPQKWKSPDKTANFGVFTRSGSGLVPTSGKATSALFRCAPEGTAQAVFTLSATEANRYAGLAVRIWDGIGGVNDGAVLFRYWGGATAGQQLQLIVAGSQIAQQAATYSGTITLSVEMRGRFFSCSVNGVAVFTLWVQDTQNRGVLSEEHCGPVVDCSLGSVDITNYCTDFSFSGHYAAEDDLTIGNINTLNGPFTAEAYQTDATSNQENFFWSKGFQWGHFSQADANNTQYQRKNIFSASNVLARKSRSNCMREDVQIGAQDLTLTVTRRGLWSIESFYVVTNRNITPDLDLRPAVFSNAFVTCGDGGPTSRSLAYQNWTTYESLQDHGGTQQITEFASGSQSRISRSVSVLSGVAANELRNTAKFEGVGDPISIVAGDVPGSATSVGGTVLLRNVALWETGSGLVLDSTRLTDWRDDVTAPATLASLVNCTLKTDAIGDVDTDGFNEAYGWYELNYVGSGDVGLTNDATKRIKPQFRLHGWTAVDVTVTVAGSPVTAFADNLGDGSVLIQLDADVAASAAIVVAENAAGPTLDSATVNAAGTTLTLVFDEAVTTDYTGLDVDGYTLSNWAGSGTNTLTATITQVYSDEAPALDYVSATGNLTGVTSGEEPADLTDSAIQNDSEVSPLPTLTIDAATNITTASGTVIGEETNPGRSTDRSAFGFVWATTPNPTLADNVSLAIPLLGGAFRFTATLSLPDNTTIYVRSYTTTAEGTGYSSDISFTTLDDPNPTINSIRFSDGGTRIRIAFSEAVTGTTGFSVDAGTITYVSGSGSAVYLFSFSGTPTTVSYTPGNVVDSISQPLGAFAGTAIEALSTLANKALAIAGPQVRPFVQSFIRRR